MKVAVVTGASSGIGKAVASSFLDKNFKVYGISRRDPGVNDPKFNWIKLDLTDSHQISSLSEVIKEEKIDVLINSAGTAVNVKALKFPQDDFEKTFDLNFRAPVLVIGELISKLNNGLVINISSLSDRIPEAGFALYCASKAALNMYFDVIAIERKELKVVNLLPDYVDTPLLRSLADDSFKWNETIKSTQIAELIMNLSLNSSQISSGARIAVINDALKDSLNYKEDLWVYNADQKSLQKIK